MEDIWQCSDKVLAVTIERSIFIRGPFSWKESEKIFGGRKLFNIDGTTAEEITSGRQRIIHSYENGILVKTETFDSKGLPVSTRIIESDSKGRPIKAVDSTEKHNDINDREWFYEKDMIAEKSGNHLKVAYYLPESNLVSKELFYSGEKLLKRLDYQYLDQDQIKQIDEYDGNERLINSRKYSYGANGRISSLSKKDETANKCNTIYFRYLSHYGNDWLSRLQYRIQTENETETEIPEEMIYRSLSYNCHDASDQNDLIKIENIVFEDGKYSGEIRKDVPHGKGYFNFNDGRKYKGNFDNGSFSGEGEMIWPDGKRYNGYFFNNLMEGEGELFWSNGDHYQGSFEKGQMHGLGVFTWNDGSRFSGLFEKGKRTDQGIIEPPPPNKENET